MSKLWEFGRGVTYLREEGYVSVCVTSCNGECYVVMFSARLVKSVKILQGVGCDHLGWARDFPRKNLVSIIAVC